VVLVEGQGSKKSEKMTWTGRTDTNKRVVFNDVPVLDGLTRSEAKVLWGSPSAVHSKNSEEPALEFDPVLHEHMISHIQSCRARGDLSTPRSLPQIACSIQKGDYIIVKITKASGHTLRGVPIAKVGLIEANDILIPGQSIAR
jgi:hypothetical protein